MPQGQGQLRPRVLGPCYSCGGFGHLSSEGQDSISFMSAWGSAEGSVVSKHQSVELSSLDVLIKGIDKESDCQLSL